MAEPLPAVPHAAHDRRPPCGVRRRASVKERRLEKQNAAGLVVLGQRFWER